MPGQLRPPGLFWADARAPFAVLTPTFINRGVPITMAQTFERLSGFARSPTIWQEVG